MSAGLALEGPLWSYALDLYGREGVAEACLILQNRLGADVCVLIFSLYAAGCGLRLDADELRAADAAVGAWRGDVVVPLRRLRTTLKGGPAPAPSATTEALRGRIKAAELAAEQIELAVLADWLARRASACPADGAADPLRAIRLALPSGAAGAAEGDADIDRAIATIAVAAGAIDMRRHAAGGHTASSGED